MGPGFIVVRCLELYVNVFLWFCSNRLFSTLKLIQHCFACALQALNRIVFCVGVTRNPPEARDAMLFGYHHMHAIHKELSDIRLYSLVPKLHMLDHCERYSQKWRLNPASWWTFKDEEAMGKIMKIVFRVNGRTLEKRSLERWLVQFTVP